MRRDDRLAEREEPTGEHRADEVEGEPVPREQPEAGSGVRVPRDGRDPHGKVDRGVRHEDGERQLLPPGEEAEQLLLERPLAPEIAEVVASFFDPRLHGEDDWDERDKDADVENDGGPRWGVVRECREVDEEARHEAKDADPKRYSEQDRISHEGA